MLNKLLALFGLATAASLKAANAKIEVLGDTVSALDQKRISRLEEVRKLEQENANLMRDYNQAVVSLRITKRNLVERSARNKTLETLTDAQRCKIQKLDEALTLKAADIARLSTDLEVAHKCVGALQRKIHSYAKKRIAKKRAATAANQQ